MPDVLKDLWTQIKGFLLVRHTVAAKEGSLINVNEPFSLKLTVTNTAPSSEDYPVIRFKNIKLLLHGTYYAELAPGQPVVVDVPGMLLPGETAPAVIVKMTALHTWPTFHPEPVLNVTVTATLDMDVLSASLVKTPNIQWEQIQEPVTT